MRRFLFLAALLLATGVLAQAQSVVQQGKGGQYGPWLVAPGTYVDGGVIPNNVQGVSPVGAPLTYTSTDPNPVMMGSYLGNNYILLDGGLDPSYGTGYQAQPLYMNPDYNLLVNDQGRGGFQTPVPPPYTQHGAVLDGFNKCVCAPLGAGGNSSTMYNTSVGMKGVGFFIRDISTSPAANMSLTAYLNEDNLGPNYSPELCASAGFGSNERSNIQAHFTGQDNADYGQTISVADITARKYNNGFAQALIGNIEAPGGFSSVCVGVSGYTAGSVQIILVTTDMPTPPSNMSVADGQVDAGFLAAPPFVGVMGALDNRDPTKSESLRVEPYTHNLMSSIWQGANEAKVDTAGSLQVAVGGPNASLPHFSAVVAVGASPTLVLATYNARRSWLIQNDSTVAVSCAFANTVTTSSGYVLSGGAAGFDGKGASFPQPANYGGPVYCVVSTGSANIYAADF